MRRYILAGAFAVVALILASLMLSSCAEREPLPTMEERLHGAWERNWQGFEQTWFFNEGLCTAHSIIPAQPVQAYFWYYTCDGDTLTISNLAASGLFRDEIKAVVEFPTDSTCTLGFVGGVNYFLKRI
jgi:outer membrane biogenesis lipoprotein LolB